MRTIGLFEAKRKLSEIVERASEGERIGITRRGKLAAVVIPAGPKRVSERFLKALRKCENGQGIRKR